MASIPRLLKQRRGIEMSLKAILGIILAVMAIVATVSIFMALLGVFTSKADQNSITFYNKVLEGIDALEGANSGDKCFFRAGLDSDWGILMFDAARDHMWQKCGGDEQVDKPQKCGGKRTTSKGCVCLCEVGGSGADDDDCNEGKVECKEVDYFTAFKFPSHEYSSSDYSWWTGTETGWVGGINWADGNVYGYDCGGSVWNSGINMYVMMKSGTNLLLKRVPEGQTANGKVVSRTDLGSMKSCRELYEAKRQNAGGTPS